MAAVRSIWIGYDATQADAFAVARWSIQRRLPNPTPVRGLVLARLRALGLYTRPTSVRGSSLWDDISEAPMSTEFACSRFLVPHLAREGWALFVDSDVMARADLSGLFALADPEKAVMVVKHQHEPANDTKMDGRPQTRYARKNWSSVILWNVGHPAHRDLTVEAINKLPGRDLHRFCWLDEDLIGELPTAWNWLAGHSDPGINPSLVHFTDGVPSTPGYENAPYADEWRAELAAWAA